MKKALTILVMLVSAAIIFVGCGKTEEVAPTTDETAIVAAPAEEVATDAAAVEPTTDATITTDAVATDAPVDAAAVAPAPEAAPVDATVAPAPAEVK